jgi:L-iditol 2-dehydrogenase
MKALQVVKPRTIIPVQAPIPHLNPESSDRLLIRTRWVSMCGSDIPFVTGSKRSTHYPLAPGAPIHECVGQVVESTAEDFKPGQWVIAIPDGNQALAEYFVAQTARAVDLPDNIGAWDTSCLIQPLSTVMNAVDRLGDLEGKSVAVVGLGSTGLFFCWLLKKRGAEHIFGLDPRVDRCRFAERLGVSRVYPMRSIEVLHRIRQSPGEWEPPEIVIEAVGHQMDTLNHCFELVQKRGTVVAFGVPDHPVYSIEFETFFRKNAVLMATVTPEWREYLAKARDLYLACQAELEPWVTHRMAIREAEKAFSLYERQGDGIVKAVLDAFEW